MYGIGRQLGGLFPMGNRTNNPMGSFPEIQLTLSMILKI
jgi:hypothetical protein